MCINNFDKNKNVTKYGYVYSLCTAMMVIVETEEYGE